MQVLDGDQLYSTVPLVVSGTKHFALVDDEQNTETQFCRMDTLLAALCHAQGTDYWAKRHNRNALTSGLLTPAQRRRLGPLRVVKLPA